MSPLNKTSIKRFVVRYLLGRDLPMSLVSQCYRLPLETRTVTDVASKTGCVPYNVNFDDLCPQFGSGHNLDCGGDIEKGLSQELKALVQEYPGAAFTIFVIPDGVRIPARFLDVCLSRGRRDISSPVYARWLEYYKTLADRGHIEYAMHGCSHCQRENLLFSRHSEFAVKRRDETRRVVEEGLAIMRKADLAVRGFRAPAWDLNSDLSLIEVLREAGFWYIGGSSPDAGLNAGQPRLSNDYPTEMGGLLNLPQNILLDWDMRLIEREIRRLVEAEGMISIKGHFANRLMTNCLNAVNLGKLRVILDHLHARYRGTIKPLTFAEIAAALQPSLPTVGKVP
jgi:peptidoglycan/xylan/chitin deacetylase (PgdA/CDA1 family)